MTRDDHVAIHGALLSLRRDTGLPVAFGGAVTGGGRGRPNERNRGRLRLSELVGTKTAALRGLTVMAGHGLGGKVMMLGRPFAVSDYPTASVITHDYDAAVGAEDLHAIVAVPVVVRRTVRAVLYGATRGSVRLGDRVIDAAIGTARMLEQDLAVQDEIEERLAQARRLGRPVRSSPAGPAPPAAVADGSRPTSAEWEEIRLAYTELRLLAQRIEDAGARGELLRVCGRLAGSAGPDLAPGAQADADRADGAGTGGVRTDMVPMGRTGTVPMGLDQAGRDGAGTGGADVRLTPRELDVLSCVATGRTNAETARHLGLRAETVKSYLREAMRKLDVHGRYEAVVAARRAGLLP